MSPLFWKKTFFQIFFNCLFSFCKIKGTISENFFLLSSWVAGLSFTSISLLVLQLWQFSFIRDFRNTTDIRNTTIWVLSNIWRPGQVRDTKFGTNILIKRNWMLQNARVTAFIVPELLRENQQRSMKLPHPTQPRLGLKTIQRWHCCKIWGIKWSQVVADQKHPKTKDANCQEKVVDTYSRCNKCCLSSVQTSINTWCCSWWNWWETLLFFSKQILWT